MADKDNIGKQDTQVTSFSVKQSVTKLARFFGKVDSYTKLAELMGFSDLKSTIAELSLEIGEAKIKEAELKNLLHVKEETIKNLEIRKHDLSRYELAETEQGSRIFVMRLKQEYASSEPMHDLCLNCYENNVKATLQSNPEHGAFMFCPRCKTKTRR